MKKLILAALLGLAVLSGAVAISVVGSTAVIADCNANSAC